ncbi:ABC transporter ATP-binding protein [Rubrimonas cliftonensis]|uniref:Putative ABC transport system ATP-binding protein n=1 Tax=Rubrimonas cliftonensis TaxID=89524 RepID=A0A1H4BRZ5_9RHOB|nr:ABC transporter ATP-binding protein [Rubrimonas cliftonensis]SEA50837.1 putative ABC transport system ATP-binding protein [Rubrimonas cliftonensis]
MLRVETLSKSYATPQGPATVLDGVSLEVGAGRTLALMGESGSGKSTLLHLVAGLDAPDEGRVFVGDAEMTGRDDAGRAALRRERVGLVFQQFNLVASLTVADNLAFQARLAGREDGVWTARLTERLGLAALTGRYPEQLSGGQQQRVAIGRALALRPALVLADEPTGALDETTAETVMTLMLELVAETGCALLMATHSARCAARLGERLVLRGGRVDAAAMRAAE